MSGQSTSSRREQLEALRFERRRAVAALATADADPSDPPNGRLLGWAAAGLVLAVLIAAGTVAFGRVPHRSIAWRTHGVVIVERETGTRFVWLDGVLHPAVNETSALLAVGHGRPPRVVLAAQADLRQAPRGAPVGIVGAPDALPSATEMITPTWTVCSHADKAAPVRVELSATPRGRPPDPGLRPAAAAVLVRSASSSTPYLLFGGRRLRVTSNAVARALNLSGPPMVVGTAFVDTLPRGPDLAAPPVPHAGRVSGVRVGARRARVGQLLHSVDDGRTYVVLDDGIAQLDAVRAALLRTLPAGPGGVPLPPLATTGSATLTLAQSTRDWPTLLRNSAGLPTRLPVLATTPSRICAVYADGRSRPTLMIEGSRADAFVGPVHASARSRHGQADAVTIPPGTGVLVAVGGHLALVDERGHRFPLRTPGELSTFGYAEAASSRLPAAIAGLIPVGPVLDPDRARRPAG